MIFNSYHKYRTSKGLLHVITLFFQDVFLHFANTHSQEKTWLVPRNPADRSNGGLHGAPLGVPPVLSPLQQVLAPPVVGVLVEDPGAFEDLTGVHVAAVPALVENGHVVRHLHGLALEVRLFPNLQPPRVSNLGVKRKDS